MIEVQDGIKIGNAIVCEDVRAEAGGKWSILGVFSGDIITAELPANIRLAVYMESHVSKPYKGPLNVRFRLDDNVLLEAQGNLDSQNGITVMPVPQLILGVERPGRLAIEIGRGDKWTEVAAKNVLLGTVKDGNFISSSASGQPS